MKNYRIAKRKGLYEIQMAISNRIEYRALQMNSTHLSPFNVQGTWKTIASNFKTFEEAEQEMKRMEPDSFEVIKEYNI
jgi:hypothetical protein